ncbi:MAG TPA: polyhydroxyalkanoate depolymerase [Caulobacteraceae bacterium]|nr:polyhydroxyalkanoate depolymerase [Caulobacteraceae bacterium]
MLYGLHEAAYYAADPVNRMADLASRFWSSPFNPAAYTGAGRNLYASAEVLNDMTRRYGKPDWRIDEVEVDGRAVRVEMQTVWASPWVKLQRFVKSSSDLTDAGRTGPGPAVLIVAPLSGHYATLLRGTVRAFLQDHDVYVSDWSNARNVPLIEGRFDFYDYVDHVRAMLGKVGPNAHVLAVCQPGPPVMAACALMAEDHDPLRPASMIFMGSPIDARLSPTVTNKMAEDRPFTWFQQHMIYSVPPPYLGMMRRVYPGFVQLYSFMAMNEAQHVNARRRYFDDLVRGDDESAEKHREFYDEYLSVLDMTEEFYLQTIDIVFQKYLLPKGELTHRGRPVKTAAIEDIALMTIEGAHDDISGVGQTQAAHELCPSLPDEMKALYVNPDVGHYGIFNGSRFRKDIYPRVRAFIAEHAVAAAARRSAAA